MTGEETKKAWHSVFVYGTLKTGESNNHFLTRPAEGRASLVGPARTVKKWPLVLVSSYEIPCLLPYKGLGYEVSGEVYDVDDRMLELLDRLESHPEFYVRSLEDVELLSQPQPADPETESKPDPPSSSSHSSSDLSSSPSRRKAWIYFVPKMEQQLLSLPYVASYTRKPHIVWPALSADKEETLRFLVSEFRKIPKNDSCSSG
uniref:Gamma-glutamylcyclotransferase family protein n=1 Tax=Amblyomma cajennense TaxID=34607 RepID=A0A023FRQ6_AMBCJ